MTTATKSGTESDTGLAESRTGYYKIVASEAVRAISRRLGTPKNAGSRQQTSECRSKPFGAPDQGFRPQHVKLREPGCSASGVLRLRSARTSGVNWVMRASTRERW